eukprot:XP_003727112.1 PREDICTED: uncharacterized protein LOC100888925 [Strongylocentrotus purpuratus]
MNDDKVPPAQRTLRKSVSFCLPDDDDRGKQDDEEKKIPDRLLLQQQVRRRSSSSTSSSQSLGRMRVLSAPLRPTPSPPVDKPGMTMKRFGGQRPSLTRSLSVPTGLTLTNVLTQQRSEALIAGDGRLPNIRSRRYSSSSMVKRKMMQHSEREFNRVAAKVSDFCRRVDSQASSDQTSLGTDSETRRGHLRPINSTGDVTGNHQTITHHGRKYRASFSISSNSMDDYHDNMNNSFIPEAPFHKQNQSRTTHDHPTITPTTTMNNNITKERIEPESEIVDDYVYDDQDDDGSELNDRISKWLDGVNNSVVQMNLGDQSDEIGSEITVIPL